MTFDSERWDTNALHDTSSNTSRLTAPVDGRYHIFGHVDFDSAAGGFRRVVIRVNGAGNEEIAVQTGPGDALHDTVLSVSTHYELMAGDYVELVVCQDSGAPVDVLARKRQETGKE